MAITGTWTVSVLGLASDLEIIMPQVFREMKN